MSNNTDIQKVNAGPPANWKDALVKAEPKFLAISDPIRTKQELGFAMQLIQGNSKLQQCSPDSILNAVINVARTNITLNPILRLAHLVPRGGKAVLDFDWKGLVKVLKDNGCVKFMDAYLVYADEEFNQDPSDIYKIHHKIRYAKTEKEQKEREIIGAYSRVVLPSGETIFTQFTPMWQIEKRKKVAQTKAVWDAWNEEMCLKTKVKMDFKLLASGESSDQLQTILKLDEENNPVNLTKAAPINAMAALLASDTSSETNSTEDVEYTEETITTYQCVKDLQLEGGVIKKDSIGELKDGLYVFHIGPRDIDHIGYTENEILVYVPEFFNLITK